MFIILSEYKKKFVKLNYGAGGEDLKEAFEQVLSLHQL